MKKNIKYFFGSAFKCWCWVGLVFSSQVYSQSLYVERIGLEHGLSQNNVTSIAQDHKGFIWLGTQTALNRYDGYTFKHYTQDEDKPGSISNGSTWALLVDREGVLWVGTYSGLNRYDEQSDSFTSYQSEEGNPKSLSQDNVWSLYEDTNGAIWVGTGKGLNHFDKQTGQFVRFLNNLEDANSISNDLVHVIFQDKQGGLLVGTDRGLNRFHYEDQNFELVGNEALNNATVTTMAQLANGDLWVGTDGSGIFVLDQSYRVIAHKTHNPSRTETVATDKIKVILRDRKNRLWVGTDNGGLDRIDEGSDRFIHYKRNSSDPNSLSENTIFSLFEDKGGVLWIGTYTQGVSKVNPFGFSLTLGVEYASPENPDPHIDIRGFLVDRHKNLWVASSSNGIRVTSPNGKKVAYMHDPKDPKSISNNKTYSFLEDKDNVIWVGTANGWLNRFNEKEKNFTRYEIDTLASDGLRHGKILSIKEDGQGRLWLGDERGGAHIFDRKTKKFTHFHHDPDDANTISFNRVFDVHIDAQDHVWLSTYGGGLNRYDPVKKMFTHYKNDVNDINTISGNYISCLVVDERDPNVLWLGLAGQGLDRMDVQSGTFKHYGIKDGLSDNLVYGIVQEGDDLWLAHNKGVSRYNVKTQKFSNYEQQDGLQNNEFNGGAYYKDTDGKLYLGGIVGYNAFYTDQIIDNPHVPPVYITGLQLFNKPVKVGELYEQRVLLPVSILNTDQLTLSYKDSVFSFEFAGLDYAFSAKNQYAYKMEGLESDWNYVDSSRRYATYTTLPPGSYKFQVKASNNNGVWNEEGASISITITPPFWHTWWFRVITLVLVVSIVFAVYAYRMRSIKERNEMLKRQVKEATSELEKEKSNLEATLVELGETKDALIEAAHKAGMADTATGVLHNVGNLLNSVNTSTGVIREMIESAVSKRFLKAGDLLEQNKDNIEEFVVKNPKGKKLIEYLIGLMEPFKRENETLAENASRLTEKIAAISETIAAQQIHAKGGAFVEELSLSQLIESSIQLQSGSITRHVIKIERDYDESVPNIKIQKTKLVQIIINLFKNAKESMDAYPDRESVLKIKVHQDSDNVYAVIEDNGMGVDQDKLETIFAHGFTTKEEGHGFGLHSCANYMTEMGGRLWAESDGEGKGARFIMSFPQKNSGASKGRGDILDERKIA